MDLEIIDLSLRNANGAYGVEIATKNRIEQDGYRTTMLHLYSHAGTHLDAPSHYLEDGGTLDELKLGKCYGPGVVVDLAPCPAEHTITAADLRSCASQVEPGGRVLLRTGWDEHAAQPDYRTRFPGLSLEAAQWLVSRQIALLGIDCPSIASLDDRPRLKAVHQTLLGAGIVIVECLANLNRVTGRKFTFCALPLSIARGDGSPVRAIGILEKD